MAPHRSPNRAIENRQRQRARATTREPTLISRINVQSYAHACSPTPLMFRQARILTDFIFPNASQTPRMTMRKVETFRKPRNKSGSVSVATLQSPAAVSERVLNKESPAAKEVAGSCSRFTGHNLAAHFTSELPAALILIAAAISPCNLSPLSRGWLVAVLATRAGSLA